MASATVAPVVVTSSTSRTLAPSNVLDPAAAGQVDLRRGVARAEQLVGQRKAQFGGEAGGDRAGMVEASLHPPTPVHRHGDDDVQIAAVPLADDPLGEQSAHAAAEPLTAAVLQVADQPAEAGGVRAQAEDAVETRQRRLARPAAVHPGRDVRAERRGAPGAVRQGDQRKQLGATVGAQALGGDVVGLAAGTDVRQEQVGNAGQAGANRGGQISAQIDHVPDRWARAFCGALYRHGAAMGSL